jgi:FkbH-like protein
VIGRGVLVDVGASLFSCASLRIGDGAVIGPHAFLCDRDEEGRTGAIVIGKNARIGANVRILGPCCIDEGASLPAGTVVRGDMSPGSGASRKPKMREGATDSRPESVGRGVPDRADTQPPGGASPLPVRRVRAVLMADFTIDELAQRLTAAGSEPHDLEVVSEVAPFDQIVPTLIALASSDAKPELAVVWTRPDRACPAFGELLAGGSRDVEGILAEVDNFASLLKSHAQAARFVFVPSWVLPPTRRGTGLLELRESQASLVLMQMNLRLAGALESAANVFVLDAQRWLAAANDGGVDPKLWFAGKMAFTSGVLAEAARDIRAGLRATLGASRKLVVLDLDDTLWGGIVGDVGWENLALGGHDPSGEAFVAFQRQLIALSMRGVALAVVSKNDEATALEAMRSHPEMLIRPSMLAAFRINWLDKAQNIVEIARELNLGLQSVVFLDDNPIERARVREALPEVYVPEWPSDPTYSTRTLEGLACFDTAAVTAEDCERNATYATERERASTRGQVSSFDEWLAALQLTVRFEPIGGPNVARATQLLNKTNQMNLRTRRLSEGELVEWSRQSGHETWTVHVSDRFGNAGLTGVLSLARAANDVYVEDYVLSCRVMGRRVEEAMVWAAKRRANAMGGHRLVALPVATQKNKPCLDFFERVGLERCPEGYTEAVAAIEQPPALVTIEGLQ